MKRIFGLLVALLTTAAASTASADPVCLVGDTLKGPNCVHEEGRPGRDPMTTVYRVEGKKVSTVWTGIGTVVKSTASFLVIEEPTENGLAKIRHNWIGVVYER